MSKRTKLILASASPRRHEILNTIGLPHRILTAPDPSGLDEPQMPEEAVADYVHRTAREKALRVAAMIAESYGPDEVSAAKYYILSADTSVILDGNILGKPHDLADATATLKMLSGREHTVHTAVALWHNKQIHKTESLTSVQFAPLSATDIAAYCETGECWGKAGAYGIQGYAARFVSHLKGSYTGVVGLPAWQTISLLRKAGYPV